MFSRGVAACCVALAMSCAGQAGAAIVQADLTGEFFTFSGAAGFWAGSANVQTFTSEGREYVNFNHGGSLWSASFAYDTDLGTLTGGAGFETLSWNSSMGASPLVTGSFNWADLGLVQDLSAVTSFEISRTSAGLGFSFEGAGFSFTALPSDYFGGSSAPSYSVSDPYALGCTSCGGVAYNDVNYGSMGSGSQIFSETLTPQQGVSALASEVSAAVPEPATWAMQILGFFGLGTALRRSRRRAAVTHANAA